MPYLLELIERGMDEGDDCRELERTELHEGFCFLLNNRRQDEGPFCLRWRELQLYRDCQRAHGQDSEAEREVRREVGGHTLETSVKMRVNRSFSRRSSLAAIPNLLQAQQVVLL